MHFLRDYQQDMVDRVHEAWELHRSVMVQMPTGTGKTHVLAHIVAEFPGKVLIVAHRVELVEQIRATVDVFKAQFGQEKTQHAASLHHSEIINHKSDIKHQTSEIQVSSIQTVSKRMGELEFMPDLVIIDEAHHALAKTYRILWEKWPEAKFLGLTATPCRMNHAGFTDLFDVLVE
ncbi:MAG: DEAD/DEAH box helicase family protein, partial [Alphaproteobacteria bacterium]|nr:DEAD/DEAH box helicase family protein [Alphaproteobacteria bacterium]